MGIEPGSAAMFLQTIFWVCKNAASGPPPREYALMRCASGWEAIFDSWSTLCLSLRSRLSLWSIFARKATQDSESGCEAGRIPTSLAIALAALPRAGPGTKKWAPVRGFGPGGTGRPSGLDGSRCSEYGSGHCCSSAVTARDLADLRAPTVRAGATAKQRVIDNHVAAMTMARTRPRFIGHQYFRPSRRNALIS